jgi:hypothetical protein
MTATRAAFVILLASLAGARADAQQFSAIWGTGPTDIWAVGADGAAAHFNGQGWVTMSTGAHTTLRAVWAAGPRDVWVVGDEGLILHLSGTAWSYVRPPVRRDFVAISGCGANDIWVVGQSEDESQPTALLHYDGQAWTSQPAPVSFRSAGIAVSCPEVLIAGATFFDPRPDQRRLAGVLMRRAGGAWTLSGWNGRAITDPQVGGASWTSVSAGGGAILLAGRNDQGPVLLLGGRGGAWRALPAPPLGDADPRSIRFTLGSDGTPLLVFDKGYGRWVGGQWAIQAATAQTSGSSESQSQQMAALAQQMQAQIARGQQPTQAQIQQMQQMGQGIQAQSSAMMAAASRNSGLMFGNNPAVWALSSADFYVADERGNVRHVAGDVSQVVWSSLCGNATMARLEPCSTHIARGAPVPAPVSGDPPAAPPEANTGDSPAPPVPSIKSKLPSLPRLPRRP